MIHPFGIAKGCGSGSSELTLAIGNAGSTVIFTGESPFGISVATAGKQ
jgi:hypothetical protein